MDQPQPYVGPGRHPTSRLAVGGISGEYLPPLLKDGLRRWAEWCASGHRLGLQARRVLEAILVDTVGRGFIETTVTVAQLTERTGMQRTNVRAQMRHLAAIGMIVDHNSSRPGRRPMSRPGQCPVTVELVVPPSLRRLDEEDWRRWLGKPECSWVPGGAGAATETAAGLSFLLAPYASPEEITLLVGEDALAAASTPGYRSPRRRDRSAEPTATARARPNRPRRITVDLSEGQWTALRALRTLDASQVNRLVRAMVEVVGEDPELIARVRERAELEGT